VEVAKQTPSGLAAGLPLVALRPAGIYDVAALYSGKRNDEARLTLMPP
jgi:hypothetical protein